jgi:hypothetical protein
MVSSFASVACCNAGVMLRSSLVIGRPVPTNDSGKVQEQADLPDAVILKMLQREVLLTRAKLHALKFEQSTAEHRIRSLKSQLRRVRHPACCSLLVACLQATDTS